jgi:hypothetical protein
MLVTAEAVEGENRQKGQTVGKSSVNNIESPVIPSRDCHKREQNENNFLINYRSKRIRRTGKQQMTADQSNTPPIRLSLFGPPPLLAGEDSKAYDDLLAQVSGAVKPADIIEEIFVHDIVDLTWEVFRWRRLETSLMPPSHYNFAEGIEKIERVNRLITIAEGRRNAALREIDRHRTTFAQILQEKVRDVEDAEFETIETKAIAPKSEADKNAI